MRSRWQYYERGGREKQAERYQEKRAEIRPEQNRRAVLHRQEKRAYDREYRRRNREKVGAQQAAWRRRNPDRVAIYARAHDLVRRDHTLSRASAETRRWVQVLLADPCAYCDDLSKEIDHIVPVVGGGCTDWTNLAGACSSCNRTKHTKPILLHLLLRATYQSKL